jgi:probable rRNA maturation factor
MHTKSKATTPKLTIEIQYASPILEVKLDAVARPNLIKQWIKSCTSQHGMLTLRFVNAAESKKLNYSYRKKDYATNVLTFPYERSKTHLVADIIFCLPVLQKEAKTQGKTLKDHLAHLIIHGCLHAQGFDHETEKDAKKMEALEVALLKKLAIPNPYLPS